MKSKLMFRILHSNSARWMKNFLISETSIE